MAMTFEEAFAHQIKMQVEVFGDGTLLQDYDDERRTQFIKDNIIAALDELHEALGEVGWKPWATSRHLNRELFKGELVDVLHFFFNLMGIADITPEELLAGYEAKAERNKARQAAGYDGIAGKDPVTKRALDDIDAYGTPEV